MREREKDERERERDLQQDRVLLADLGHHSFLAYPEK